MKTNEKCSVCGAYGVYARGLCTRCYQRMLKNGGVITPTLEQMMKAKWIGRRVGTWEVIETLPKQKALIKCTICGRTKIVSRANWDKKGIRPCVCEVEHLEPKTQTQARVYKAFLHAKGNASKAGEELGMSRQAVWSVLKTMKKGAENGR